MYQTIWVLVLLTATLLVVGQNAFAEVVVGQNGGNGQYGGVGGMGINGVIDASANGKNGISVYVNNHSGGRHH
jgi:hypothetical protein